MGMKLTECIGRRVIASDSAEEIGEVKRFVFDQSGRSITQVQIGGRKRKAELVDWADIGSFGADAVMVTSADRVHHPIDDRQEAMVDGDIAYLGVKVLSSDGVQVGKVDAVHFDESSGTVLGAEISEGFGLVPTDRIHGLGSFALVVSAPSA